MKQLMSLVVRGKTTEYDFTVEGYSEHLEEYWDEGLDINPIVNVIPQWIVDIGLSDVWCFFQDLSGKYR